MSNLLTTLEVPAPVTALALLRGGALAVGTLVGTVHISSNASGSRGPDVKLLASGPVRALLGLPQGGVLVGVGRQVLIWPNMASLSSDSEPRFSLESPAVIGNLALASDGSLLAGGAVFHVLRCTPGTYSPGGLYDSCIPCKTGWRSLPGSAGCDFGGTLWGLKVAVPVTFAAVALAVQRFILISRYCQVPPRWVVGVAGAVAALGAATCLLAVFLAVIGGMRVGAPSCVAAGLGALAGVLSTAPALCYHRAACWPRAHLFPVVLIFFALWLLLLSTGLPSGQTAWTFVGEAVGPLEHAWLYWLGISCTGIAVILHAALGAVCLGQEAAGIELQRHDARQEHPAEIYRTAAAGAAACDTGSTSSLQVAPLGPSGLHPLDIQVPPMAASFPSPPRAASAAALIPRAHSAPALLAGLSPDPHRASCRTRLARFCRVHGSAARVVGASWCAKHAFSVAASGYTIFITAQRLGVVAPSDATEGLLVSVLFVCSCQAVVSTIAVCKAFGIIPKCCMQVLDFFDDKHFRLIVILKYVALSLKLLILSLPSAQEVAVNFWWRCEEPVLCPSECGSFRSGRCSTTPGEKCMCLGWSPFSTKTLLSCVFTSMLSFGLAFVNFKAYLQQPAFRTLAPGPRRTLAGQFVLSVVPPATQLLYLVLLRLAGNTYLRICDTAIIVFPGFALSFMANEAGGLLRTWNPAARGTNGCLQSNALFTAMKPIAMIASCLAAGVCFGAPSAAVTSGDLGT